MDLKPFLDEFRPRFAAMTGICAGDRKKVKLGDLIVAECAYLYEEGKIIAGPDGQATHLIEAASLLGWAGMYLFEHGSYAITEPLYRRALAICEQQVGPDHPDTAISLNNLAALYHKQGKYELAEPLYQRALAIREQQLGPDHSLVAHVLDGLATLYRDQGNFEKAEPLFLRALAIRERALGPSHPDLAETLHEVAVLRQAQGHHDQAYSLYERALAMRTQIA